MAFGLESGMTNFFERRESLFNKINFEGTFEEKIKELKSKINTFEKKPTVVILGAGPAGLMRAVLAISNGNPTRIIEKRSEDTVGRNNTVALTEVTIKMLKYCGIYQYLIENKLIFPPNTAGYICVRLGDLEKAMKAILKEISPEQTIDYGSKVSHITPQADKIDITIELTDGQKEKIEGVDILVNAEGSNGTTNSLLNIRRNPVLPNIPVIAAIFKDERPKIQGIGSFFKYMGKSIAYIAITIYYHVQFFFKFICSKNFRNQFTGALILKTPGQNYLGCGFSDEINKRLLSFKQLVNEKRTALEYAQSDEEIEKCSKELEATEKKYNSFAKHWINLALCGANLISLRLSDSKHYMYRAGYQDLKSYEVIEVGADYASECCKSINNSAILLAGDAYATVDPSTGLGCNTAIQSSTAFLDFLWDANVNVPLEQRLKAYDKEITSRRDYIHEASKAVRKLYRPDAVQV